MCDKARQTRELTYVIGHETHVYIFESSQLIGLYVGDLLQFTIKKKITLLYTWN